jgi:APA family basic amino acid/polyamine antiporter
MLNLTATTWIAFVVWLVIGLVIYFAYSRRHSALGRVHAQPANAKTTKRETVTH